MMIQTNWYAITGAPSSGKTTLIQHLSNLGYHVAPEVARDYIRSQMKHNHNSLSEIKHDNLNFQRSIFALMLKREHQLPKDELIFSDRGTPDSIGYFKLYNLEVGHVIKACQQIRYKKIFFCHGLPVVHDSIRDEDDKTAQELGSLIYQAYIDLGYQVIELPQVSVEERMDIILSHIEMN